MNLEMAVTEEDAGDRRKETEPAFLLSGAGKTPVTAEGGLDVAGQRDKTVMPVRFGGGWHPGFRSLSMPMKRKINAAAESARRLSKIRPAAATPTCEPIRNGQELARIASAATTAASGAKVEMRVMA